MLYLRICYRELCYKELVVYQTRLVHREQVQIGEAGRGGGGHNGPISAYNQVPILFV